ncbi:ArsR family transcriptional regulator [Streptomyces viridochromogenes]|uniref:ArsR family transcriptional regulator n=1 Tax=Streptomyces viridochromogenes TaxID=1938 RepID=A0A0L8JL29_STRVR|nr:ArsR family transcriptional regulator [Streptomyces viridochromogenes]
MSVTIDITGLPHERISFCPSPLAELGAALHALAEPAHHARLHAWTTTTAAALEPELADRLHESDFMWRSTRSDILLPARPRETLAEELDDLDRMDDERFVSSALEISCASHYTHGAPSPLVDERMRRRALDLAAARGPRQSAFAERMLADPSATRAWVRRLLEDCDDAFFADTWRRVRVQLAADARHKTELLRHKGLAEAVADASSAMVLEEDEQGSRIVVDKLLHGRTSAEGSGVTFLPTAFGWPHLFALHAPGWQPVVQYPVPARDLGGAAPVEAVKLRLEAVAHPMRMRLCRSLARGAYTTSELADAYGITAPEVSRHLAVMRKAGLLTTQRRGRYVLHQLDVSVVARLGSDFLESVLR